MATAMLERDCCRWYGAAITAHSPFPDGTSFEPRILGVISNLFWFCCTDKMKVVA